MSISFFTRPRTCSTCSWMAAIVLSAILITGSVHLRSSVPTHTASAPTTHPSVVDTSTTPAIPMMPCSVYDWFIEPDSTGKAKIRTINIQHIASLHALTCQWAVMTQELSVDSTQLPRYVEIMSDTLRLSEDAFAYTVQMTPAPDDPAYIPAKLYFVAEVADSLYYRDLIDADPRRGRSFASIRALRPIHVPNANTQYLWVETKRVARSKSDSLSRTVERWYGNVLTYDPGRGVRYLRGSVVRREVRHNGTLHGAAQLDVSIPEPGIMSVGERGRWGADVTKGYGWRHWMGTYVIDPDTVSDTSRYRDMYYLENPEALDR